MELNGNTLVSGNADSTVKVYTNAFMYNVHMICVTSTVLYLNLIQYMCMQCSVVWANDHLYSISKLHNMYNKVLVGSQGLS